MRECDSARRWAWATALSLAALAGCGGGGGSGDQTGATPPPPSIEIITGSRLPSNVDWQPPAGAEPAADNFVYLESDAGDAVGGGGKFVYTQADSSIAFEYWNGQYQFRVGHPQMQWTGVIAANDSLRKGFYGDAMVLEQRVSPRPGIWWSTLGRECDAVEAWFVVDSIAWDSGLATIQFRFEQKCAGATGALRGKVRWTRATVRPTPITPAPADLWRPSASAVPSEGSYLYLEGEAGEWVSGGGSKLFRAQDGTLDIVKYGASGFYSVVAKSGLESWNGNLIGINGSAVRAGYYPGVQKSPYHDLMIGAMEWTHNLRGCGLVNGWFVVDNVEYIDDLIVYLELRFEQRCDASSAVLRGQLRWSLLDVLPPAGPTAPSADTWQPAVGSTPASGDYVYLQSEATDSVAQGIVRLFTPADSTLVGTPFGSAFHLRVDAATALTFDFKTMSGLTALQAGEYADLPPAQAGDRIRGGMSVSVDGRVCTASSGRVTIDALERDAAGTVSLLELRFEQRCAGDVGVLHGKLRWSPASGGIVSPAPATLWQPPAGVTPADGRNYIYVESEYGDPIANGDARLHAAGTSVIQAGGSAGGPLGQPSFGISLNNQRDRWNGAFYGIPGENALRVGLYGNLPNVYRHAGNAAIDWSGRGVGCFPNSTGWFVVDRISYDDVAAVSEIELRFEHHCTGFPGALRGKIRWSAADTTTIPGPTAIPGDLWQPRPSDLPSSGNYVYLESEYGDFVGRGRNRTFTLGNSDLTVTLLDLGHVWVNVHERNDLGRSWFGEFMTMQSLTRLQPGFYDEATRSASNPARGSVSWVGDGRGCNMSIGWLAVDSITTSNGALTSFDARFEQHCEYAAAPLRGKIHWVAP